MSVWLAFIFSFVTCVLSQAPGDGDPLCVDEVVDGEANSLRPTHADNVRPLMDSRDYFLPLAGDEMVHNIPWQQVDYDNNNANTVGNPTVVTEVSDVTPITCVTDYVARCTQAMAVLYWFCMVCIFYVSSGLNLEFYYAVV